MQAADFKSATIEDIEIDPARFGAPTFEEFRRNPEKYTGRKDESFAAIDRGSQMLNRHVSRQRYEIEGFKCKSLEEVERVARSQGIQLHELDYRPEVIPLGAGKCDILVKFMSKEERTRRDEKPK